MVSNEERQATITAIKRAYNIRRKINYYLQKNYIDLEIYNQYHKLISKIDTITYLVRLVIKESTPSLNAMTGEYSFRYDEWYFIEELYENISKARCIHIDNLVHKIYNQFDIKYKLKYKDLLKKISYKIICYLYDQNCYYNVILYTLDDLIMVLNEYIFDNDEYNKFVECFYISKKKQELKIYEKELIEKTWTPSRLFNWCMDEGEKQDFDLSND